MSDTRITDEQYLDILKKILDTVSQPGFKGYIYDSTTPGNKYTESNCGFCNEGYTTLETALFPKGFPGRPSMKYRETWHRCPFDKRKIPGLNGCYYTCILRRLDPNTNLVALVKEAIDNREALRKEYP